MITIGSFKKEQSTIPMDFVVKSASAVHNLPAEQTKVVKPCPHKITLNVGYRWHSQQIQWIFGSSFIHSIFGKPSKVHCWSDKWPAIFSFQPNSLCANIQIITFVEQIHRLNNQTVLSRFADHLHNREVPIANCRTLLAKNKTKTTFDRKLIIL